MEPCDRGERVGAPQQVVAHAEVIAVADERQYRRRRPGRAPPWAKPPTPCPRDCASRSPARTFCSLREKQCRQQHRSFCRRAHARVDVFRGPGILAIEASRGRAPGEPGQRIKPASPSALNRPSRPNSDARGTAHVPVACAVASSKLVARTGPFGDEMREHAT